MSSTYTGKIVSPEDIEKWDGYSFRQNCYLTYNGVSGTQSDSFGATLIAPGQWYITEPASIYYIDCTLGNVTIILPDANSTWANKTFSFVKPSLVQTSNYIASITAGQIVKARAAETAGTLTLTNIIMNLVRI